MQISKILALSIPLFALPAQAKDPALGATTFIAYDAFLSPQQEGDEEDVAPKNIEPKSTPPFTPREQRKSRGYGQIRFARDLSRAYVDVQIAGLNPADILMFHIHCGPPGYLGPILVDLGKAAGGDLKTTFAGGKLSVEISNSQLNTVSTLPSGHGLKPPEACPVDAGFPYSPDQLVRKQPLPNPVKTIAGMEYLARKGVLYFNLHTKSHTFYGEMRGQIYAAQKE